MQIARRTEVALETALFRTRWLLVPFYVGLVVAMVLLLVKFAKATLASVDPILHGSGGEAMIAILGLVDVALVANLLLIIIFAGYENFISKIDLGESEDRPKWMGNVGFSDLKIKLIGSIVAISAIDLLKYFFNVQTSRPHDMGWAIAIHACLVVSGVLFAIMDRIAARHPG
ncbi:MAG TPA: YqhA family protein [Caldimonas sp.]|nr:YqhA family protein [Caldimonas sp.]